MEDDALNVEISKINFLLENLYALLLRDAGASTDDVQRIADEMRRQATDLPATEYGGPTPDLPRFQEMVGARLDMFFAGVRERMASDRGG